MLYALRPCRHEIDRERKELLVLRDEHKHLAERAVRQAARARDALVGVTIILTVEDVERLFHKDKAHDDRRG